MKSKCDGGIPCARCKRFGLQCVAPPPRKRGRPTGSKDKKLRKMPKRPKKEEENDSTDMDFGLFDNLSAGIGVLSDMGMAGVGAAGELVGNTITHAQQWMENTFLRNMLRHVYGCVPLSNENLTVL